MTAYKQRVWEALAPCLGGPYERALDFGSGDGWYARRVLDSNIVRELVALDVKRRDRVYVEPLIYSSNTLPFDDRHFDLSYAIDVLHHCGDPGSMIGELARVTKGRILIKDHVYASRLGWAGLAVMDEVGNRRFEIPSPRHYQRQWEWESLFERAGWVRRLLIHPAPCHVGLLGAVTNRLQYVACYERVESLPP